MELFKLFGTIAITNADANDAIDDTTDKAEKSQGKISRVFGKLGSIAAKAGKAVAIGVGAGATALTALSKTATEHYAEYEQLVGGVETLFGNSSKKVIEYANQAYKTAGLSANDYMETVTSFSASLLQSLGGDTEKASEKANQAIVDMSDNANKMGTSMESIQNAYQGFAKQNYTMLDNLKLGYGGTKEEMQRLLEDAEKISGIKYDISSYADVVDAIHVMQESMGIAGTTSKEASTTIQGSISTMKSAWTNFLTGMADPSQDFNELVGNLVDSVVTVADNIVPRISALLPRLVSGISQVVQSLAGYLPGILNQLLPALVSGATGLMQALTDALPAIIQTIVTVLPQLLEAVTQIFNGIVSALPEMISLIVSALPELLPQLITGIVQLIVGLCDVLPQIIQPLIDALPTIITLLVAALIENLPSLIMGCIQLVAGIVTAIPQIISALIEAIPQIISALIEAFTPLGDDLTQLVTTIMDDVKAVFVTVWDAIKSVISDVLNNIKDKFSSIWNSIKSTLSGVIDGIKSTISSGLQGAFSTVSSVLSNIKDKFSSIFESAKNIVKGAIDKIKGFFNFSWSLPKLKLPHISISGSFSLTPPSVPKFGISWYKKAMDEPYMFTKPTIFDVNPVTGQAKGAGEAGDELMIGKDTLMTMIRAAVKTENADLMAKFDLLLDLLGEFFPQVLNSMNRAIVLDSGVLVGEIAPEMDDALGEILRRKGR